MAIMQQGEQTPPIQMIEKAVSVIYTNWRGETAERMIVPIELYWGSSEWHPKEQWLLKVWDVERGAYRAYALKDIKKWG